MAGEPGATEVPISTGIKETTLAPTEKVYAVEARLKSKQDAQLIMPDDSIVECTIGLDEQREVRRDGWVGIIKTGQKFREGFILYDKAGNVINIEERNGPLLLGDISRVEDAQGSSLILTRDAFGNPTFYKVPEKQEVTLDEEYKWALDSSIALWESALKSEDEVRQVVQGVLGDETAGLIGSIVDLLEKYPELQRYSLFLKGFDPKRIAAQIDSADKARDFLENNPKFTERLPYPLQESEIEEVLVHLVEKAFNNESLTPDEEIVSQAIRLAHVANAQGAHSSLDRVDINEVTRRFAIANLAENFICESVIDKKVFFEHQKRYAKFVQKLNQTESPNDKGSQIESWFTPYEDKEFNYGIAINGGLANSGGILFIHPGMTIDNIASILDHERIHEIRSAALERGFSAREEAGRRGEIFTKEKYHEVFVETLTQLISTEGNVETAIELNSNSGSGYKTGVHELLSILKEIEDKTNDRLLGSRLLINGLRAMADGEIGAETQLVRDYYETRIVGRYGAFDKRMDRYRQEKRIYMFIDDEFDEFVLSPLDEEYIYGLIDSTVEGTVWEDLEENERKNDTKEWFEERKKSPQTRSLNLLFWTEQDSIRSRLREKLLADPRAKEIITRKTEYYYENYLELLKRIRDERKIPQ